MPESSRWTRASRTAVVAAVAVLCGVGAPGAMAAFLDGATAQSTMSTGTLQAPTGLTSGLCLLGSVTLTWSDAPGTLATGYEVRWSTTNGGPYTTGSATTLLTTRTVTGLSPLTTYHFVVRSTAGNWRSANSNQRSVSCAL